MQDVIRRVCFDCTTARVHLKEQNNSSTATERSLDVVVLSALVFFIEAERENPNLPIIKLSELSKMYDKRMFDLDPTYDRKVNSTRLTGRLLGQIVDLRAQKQGKGVFLFFDADMSLAGRFGRTKRLGC